MIHSEVSCIKLAPVILSETKQAQVEATNRQQKHVTMTWDIPGVDCCLMANGKEGVVLGDSDKSSHPHHSVRAALGQLP